MDNLKELRRKFTALNGAKFITINGYESKSSGEIANHNINVNISSENAKKEDLQTLKNITVSELLKIGETCEADSEDTLNAIKELIESAEKNLSNEKTAQSIGQDEAYIHLGGGLKLHIDTFDVYVSGFANSKKVIKEGVHKKVNSKPKTLVKKAIQKQLKMYNFRNYKVGNGNSISITGNTLQLK